MLRSSLLLILLGLCLISQAQDMVLGKVPETDLAMTTCDFEPDAAAMVLDDVGEMEIVVDRDSYVGRLTRHVRVKIFKEAGFDLADNRIFYYSAGGQRIENLVAYVHHANGNKAILSKSDFKEEKVNKNVSVIIFTFSGVKEGTVLEFRYQHIIPGLIQLKDWQFQRSIPVRRSSYTFKQPGNFSYTYEVRGANQVQGPAQTQYKDDLGSLTNLPFYQYQWVARDVPAMDDEPMAANIEDFRSAIRLQLTEYRSGNGVKEEVLSTWDKLRKELYDRDDFGKFYREKKFSKKAFEAFQNEHPGNSTADTLELAQKIYTFIQKNIAWNEETYFLADQKPDHTFSTKKGSTADINILLLALLRQNGILAYPVLCAERSNGTISTKYPMLHQFDRFIVLFENGGKTYFLDPFQNYQPFGYPNGTVIGTKGFVITDSDYKWVDIKTNSNADVLASEWTIFPDGRSILEIQGRYDGLNANIERLSWSKDSSGTHWQKRIQEKVAQAKIIGHSTNHLYDLTQSFNDRVKFELQDAVQITDSLMYIQPILYTNYTENPFKSEKRMLPIQLGYGSSEKQVVTINYPEGYEIAELPKSETYSVAGRSLNFKYSTAVPPNTNNKIQVFLEVKVNNPYIPISEYGNLRRMYEIMMERIPDQIILRKKAGIKP